MSFLTGSSKGKRSSGMAMNVGLQIAKYIGVFLVIISKKTYQFIKTNYISVLWVAGAVLAYFFFPKVLFWVYIAIMIGILIGSYFLPSLINIAVLRSDLNRVNTGKMEEALLMNYFAPFVQYNYLPQSYTIEDLQEHGVSGVINNNSLQGITVEYPFAMDKDMEMEVGCLSDNEFLNNVGMEWSRYADRGSYGLDFIDSDDLEDSTLKANEFIREIKMVNPKTKNIEYVIDPDDRFVREGVQLWSSNNEFILSLPVLGSGGTAGLLTFEDTRKPNSSGLEKWTPRVLQIQELFNILKASGVITKGRIEGNEIIWDAVVDQKQLAANNLLKHAGLIKQEDFINATAEVFPDKIVLRINELIPGKATNVIIKTLRSFEAEVGAFASSGSNINGVIEVVYRTNAEQAVIDGNLFLQEKGVIKEEEFYDFVRMDRSPERTVITVDGTMGALNNDLIFNKLEKFKTDFGAIKLSKIDLPGGGAKFNYIVDSILDDSSKTFKQSPGHLDIDKMEVDCAINEEGEIETLKFDGTPGLLISGIPGSGKTAGATSFLLPLALSPHVDLNIIDGKGGADWSAYENVSNVFISGSDGNMDEINDFLLDAVKDMDNRVKTNKTLLGDSNFWNVPAKERYKKNRKYKMIIIDECQELFTALAGASKEEKEVQKQIISSCTKLIKKGRSAGITVVFLTQKTTADSIPTAIRDNCALRISFRQMTPTAETVAIGFDLGGIPGAARPINIPPSRKGGAVIMTDSGELREVRFFYIPEQIQEKLLN